MTDQAAGPPPGDTPPGYRDDLDEFRRRGHELVELLDLPARFRSDGIGGGVIQDSASSATLTAIVAAREAATGGDATVIARLRAYTSDRPTRRSRRASGWPVWPSTRYHHRAGGGSRRTRRAVGYVGGA